MSDRFLKLWRRTPLWRRRDATAVEGDIDSGPAGTWLYPAGSLAGGLLGGTVQFDGKETYQIVEEDGKLHFDQKRINPALAPGQAEGAPAQLTLRNRFGLKVISSKEWTGDLPAGEIRLVRTSSVDTARAELLGTVHGLAPWADRRELNRGMIARLIASLERERAELMIMMRRMKLKLPEGVMFSFFRARRAPGERPATGELFCACAVPADEAQKAQIEEHERFELFERLSSTLDHRSHLNPERFSHRRRLTFDAFAAVDHTYVTWSDTAKPVGSASVELEQRIEKNKQARKTARETAGRKEAERRRKDEARSLAPSAAKA